MRRILIILLTLVLSVPVAHVVAQAPESNDAPGALVGNGISELAGADYNANGVAILGPVPGLERSQIVVAFKNLSPKALSRVVVTLRAEAADGTVVATAESSFDGLAPIRIEPGGYGFGIVEFSSDLPLEQVTYNAAAYERLSTNDLLASTIFSISDVKQSSEAITGTILNPSDVKPTLVTVALLCFGPDGGFRYYATASPVPSQLPPHATGPFSFLISGGVECPWYVLASTAKPFK